MKKSLKELAEAAKKVTSLTPDEAIEKLKLGLAHQEAFFQKMIDSIVAIQDEWPMPEEGWQQFVEDVQRTNEKHGFNLQIRR